MQEKMDVIWGDSLEILAARLFRHGRKKGPFAREAVIVGSPLAADWLQQFYLHDLSPRPQQILANWDFLQLHPFVNDWLEKAVHDTPIGARQPLQHPYASEVLQWRLWTILAEPGCAAKYPQLHRYCSLEPRRRLDLAATLARLFDDYQNYRHQTLVAWQQPGCYEDLAEDNHWQADLWRELVDRNPMTYIQSFLDCRRDPSLLRRSGIGGRYARISLFNLTALSPLYRDFFQQLGAILPVELYLFNPSSVFWLDDSSRRLAAAGLALGPSSAQEPTESHPLLASFGKGLQPLLRAVVDEYNVNHELFTPSAAVPATLLQRLQHSIRAASAADLTGPAEAETEASGASRTDTSLQVHLCHNPQREVEVVHGLLLDWFANHPDSQPRDVQVLVADYPAFVPLLEAEFNINRHGQAIPALFLYQPPASAGAVTAAFQKLIELGESRLTAPEIFGILNIEPVAARYGLDAGDLDSLGKLLAAAQVSWGRDRAHAVASIGLDPEAAAAFPDTMTWQRGLDRLLIGLCHGPADGVDPLGCVDAGDLGPLHLVSAVEGERVARLDALATFYDDLLLTIEECRPARTVPDWCEVYAGILDRFFLTTEHSHRELAQLRRTLQKIRLAAVSAEEAQASLAADTADPANPAAMTVEAAVMAAHVEKHNRSLSAANNCTANAVVFSPLQTMAVTPRRLLVVMGLSEGIFPRADFRAPFDLLDRQFKDGDRSLRREDRLAFLEAIMQAREQLLLTYTGLSDTHDDQFPPSSVLHELIDAMAPALRPIRHPLNPHDPRYFTPGKSNLVSYSQRHYREACALAAATAAATAAANADAPANAPPAASAPESAPVSLFTPTELADPPKVITLSQLHGTFINPAKDFLNHVLSLYLPDPDGNPLGDSEMFEADSLEKYQLNDFILKELLDAARNGEISVVEERGKKPSLDGENFWRQRQPLFARLQESGMLPLGTSALPLLANTTKEIFEDVCGTYRNDLKSSYAHVLLNLPEAKPYRLTLTRQDVPVTLTGELAIDVGKQLFFRYTSSPDKDRVKAWISHLFACACGENITTFVGYKKNSPCHFNPISRETAGSILGDIVRCHLSARSRCLPFAPKAALDFLDSLKPAKSEDKDEYTDDEIAAALSKARQNWAPPRSFTTPPDRYMLKIWGPDGPFGQPAGDDLLLLFWGLKRTSAQPEGGKP